MEFRNFSLYIKHTKVSRFIDALVDGNIEGTICKSCKKKYFPPRADCPECMGSDIDWIPIETSGRLFTFTKIYVPPEHFSPKQPSMPFSSIKFEPCPVGVIETEEGLRIMGWMPKVDIKKIHVGDKMKASSFLLPDGNITIILEPII